MQVPKKQIQPCDPDSSLPESRFSSMVIDRKTVESYANGENDDIPTEKRTFSPRENPHDLKRQYQMQQDYVWYAAYDEDILGSKLLLDIALRCKNKAMPQEFHSVKLSNY